MRLEVLNEATSDTEEAVDWYAAARAGLDGEFRVELNRVIDRLLELPHSAPVYFLEYRAAVLARFPFRLVYRVAGEALVVVAVRHTSRDPEVLKDWLIQRP